MLQKISTFQVPPEAWPDAKRARKHPSDERLGFASQASEQPRLAAEAG